MRTGRARRDRKPWSGGQRAGRKRSTSRKEGAIRGRVAVARAQPAGQWESRNRNGRRRRRRGARLPRVCSSSTQCAPNATGPRSRQTSWPSSSRPSTGRTTRMCTGARSWPPRRSWTRPEFRFGSRIGAQSSGSARSYNNSKFTPPLPARRWPKYSKCNKRPSRDRSSSARRAIRASKRS